MSNGNRQVDTAAELVSAALDGSTSGDFRRDLRWIANQMQIDIAAVIERDIAVRPEMILRWAKFDITLQIALF